jgi:PAS domain S-box-containing protein
LKILHVEDNSCDAEIIAACLAESGLSCDITRTQTSAEYHHLLEQPDWDVILSDYALPSFNGISALRYAVRKRPDVPFIFVSGVLGEDIAVETLKMGASDYVVKSHLGRLGYVVLRARREADLLVREKEAARKDLQTETLLQESADRLLLATRAGSVGIWDHNVVDNVLLWDDQMFRLYGTERERFDGAYEAFQSLVHPEDRARVAELVRATLAGEKNFDTEFRVVWSDGSIHIIRAIAEVKRDAAGRAIRLVGTNWDVTEQTRTADALRQSEAKLKEAQRIARVGYWHYTPSTGELIWSEEAFRLFGLNPEKKQVTREESLLMHTEASRSLSIQAMGHTMETGESHEVVLEIQRQDGSSRHIEQRGRLTKIKADGVEVPAIEGTFLDVTERVAGELALRHSNAELERRVEERTRELADTNTALLGKIAQLGRSEQRFQQLVEAAPYATLMVGADGLITLVNSQTEQLFGFLRDELLGQPVDILLPSSHRGQSQQRENFFPDLANRFMGAGIDLFGMRKDGSRVPIEIGLSPITTDEGEFVLASVIDMTERRKKQDELTAQEAKFRFLAESMPQMVWTANPDGAMDYYNQKWLEYTGTTSEWSQEWGWGRVLHPDDQEESIRVWQKSLSTGKPYNVEFRLRRAGDGIYRWHLGRALALKNEQGVIVKWFGTCTDVEDYKSAEAENLHLREELEDRVVLRTSELESANIQLTEFSRKLEESNRELQDFASVAAHDLQEPLRKVQAFGDRLKAIFLAGGLDPTALDYLDRMLRATSRMHALINDLLSFSRVATKARPFESVDLLRVAREVLSDLEERIDATGAVVQLEGLPVAKADPTQMRQLLQNLIGNSLKFHKPGVVPTVRIWGGLINSPQYPEGACQFVVKDNGIGFDEKYLDRIFTVFQRLHTRSEYEGTGVGLAICRKIVHRHGGEITAVSAPGEGAAFHVTLPRRPPIAQAVDYDGVLALPGALTFNPAMDQKKVSSSNVRSAGSLPKQLASATRHRIRGAE